MTEPRTIRVSVVGHTNTGKTSLLRTLTRNVSFGDVSDRPATTRHVEGTALLIDGEPAIELYDTPGLEDSIGLFEHLDRLRTDPRAEAASVIEQFLASDAAHHEFAQEAKALRQVLQCDVALYVIDAREHVMGRHRDELTILSWCARPVVPVLNFLASPAAQAEHWRQQLARTNMHVVAEFDTVVVDELSEQRLLEKLRTVLDAFRPTIDALIAQRQQDRTRLIAASARAIAELLLDVASFVDHISLEDKDAAREGIEAMCDAVRARERVCVDSLLALHRFRSEDYDAEAQATVDAALGMDLFSPEALKQFGFIASRGAAVGAVAGVAVDAMTGGLTLGAAAATGAALGAAIETLRKHGSRFLRRMRQTTEVRCDPQTIRLLGLRQIAFVRALLVRGHASQTPTRPAADLVAKLRMAAANPLPAVLQRAQQHAHWSTLTERGRWRAHADESRRAALSELTRLVDERLHQPMSDRPTFP
jgi:GTPase Era involved in 16S rRNA processing